MELMTLANIPAIPSGLTVTVYQAGTSNLATLYDRAGAALANPFASDSTGRLEFQAATGKYDVKLGGGAGAPDVSWHGGQAFWVYGVMLVSEEPTYRFPSIQPSLNLDFAKTQALDRRIDFTRSSEGTYFGADGKIHVAGVDEPRFDFDPVTGECKGLLIEEQKTNLSPVITNWFPSRISLASGVTGLDGSPMTKLVASAELGTHSISTGNMAVNSGTVHAFSVYIREAGVDSVRLRANDGTAFLADVVVSLETGLRTHGGTDYQIDKIGNGIYRITLFMTPVDTTVKGQRY